MMKILAIVSLMLIGTFLGVSSSCDSCGSECASACGTRYFRTCCFNYLRKKRGSDAAKFWSQDMKNHEKQPIFIVKNLPESWFGADEFQPTHHEDTADSRLQIVYGM